MHVVEIQDFLIDIGFKLPRSNKPAGLDGVYGIETETAVKGFQAKVGIRTDGIVGPKTLAALEAVIAKRPDLEIAGPQDKPVEIASDVRRVNRPTFWVG